MKPALMNILLPKLSVRDRTVHSERSVHLNNK